MAYDSFDMLFIKIDTMQFPKLQLFWTCEMFALQRMEVYTALFIYTNSRITQQVLNPMSRDIYYLHACRVIVTERYTL